MNKDKGIIELVLVTGLFMCSTSLWIVHMVRGHYWEPLFMLWCMICMLCLNVMKDRGIF